MKRWICVMICFLMLFQSAYAAKTDGNFAVMRASNSSVAFEGVAVFAENSKAVNISDEIIMADNLTKVENGKVYVDRRTVTGSGEGYVAADDLGMPYAYNEQNGVVIISSNKKDDASELLKKTEETEYIYACGIYVSPRGNNSNVGTFKKPFKTIGAAIDAYKSSAVESAPSVYILTGDYHISQTIILDKSLSGITFSSYDNQRVSISGGFSGGTISKASSSDLNGKLPKEHLGKIIKWDISGYSGLADDTVFRDYGYYAPELIDGDCIATVARWPDKGWAHTGEQTRKISDTVYEFKTNAPVTDMTLDNAKIRGFWAWDYNLLTGKILGCGETDSTIRVSTNVNNDTECMFNSNRRYYLYNIPEEVNSPGEYYIDYDKKELYYYPKSDNLNLQLTGLKDGIFNIQQDCDDVNFYGLIFENTRGTAISGEYCDGITVDSCLFQNIGGRGIRIDNTYRTQIVKSVFKNIGDCSVILSGGSRPSLVSSDSSISNCEFYNGGRIVGTYSPFVQIGGVNNVSKNSSIGFKIENNFFYNHMHSAIIFDGNDIIIKNNIFDNVVNETQDSGAVYSRVYATYRGNEITNNIFRNIRTFKISERYADAVAVYCDDLLPGVKVESNVFENCTRAFTFGGGKANKFNNNLVYNCSAAGGYSKRGNNAEAVTAPPGYLYCDVKAMQNDKYFVANKWYTKYPDFKAFVDEIDLYNAASNITIDENGNKVHIDKTAEEINNAEFNNNIFVSSGAIETNNNFMNLQKYDEQTKCGVNNVNSYYSTDLSKVSIDGNKITASDDILASHNIPDVSKAGVNDKNPMYSDLGQSYVFNAPSKKIFEGYRYESFDGYSDNAAANRTREFNVISGGSSKIDGNGFIKVPKGESIELKIFNAKGCFIFTADFSGKFNVDFGNGVKFDADSAVSSVYEFRFDGENSNVSVYTINDDGDFVKYTDGFFDSLNSVDMITIKAEEDLKLNAVALGSGSGSNADAAYLSLGFEDCANETAVEDYSANIITYGAYGYHSALITDDGNGNMALRYKSFVNPNYGTNYINTDINFSPVKLRDNVISVEYKIKADVTKNTRLANCLAPVGFNEDTPDRYVEIPIIQDLGNKNLVANDRKIEIARTSEYTSDYIKLKTKIDAVQKQITVYKEVQGEWQYICAYSVDELPDYINSLTVRVHQDTTEESTYWFDDIRVYNQNSYLYSQETVVKNGYINFKPDYIPGTDADFMCVGVYTDGDRELVDAALQPYKPDMKFKIKMPSDGKEYIIRRFVFSDDLKPIFNSEILR